MRPYLQHGKPERRPELLNLDDHLIISTYGAEYRGIVQYYLLAGDVWRLNRLRMGRRDLHAQDLGRQAPLHGDARWPASTRPKSTPRTGRARASRPASNGQAGNHWSPGSVASRCKRQKKAVLDDRPPVPATHPQGADHPAPGGPVRMVSATRGRGGPPSPQTRRPHQTGTPTARVGEAHGANATQDPHRLHPLPRGHPRTATHRRPRHSHWRAGARKRARLVRTGGRWKRTCTRQAPRQRPTGVSQLPGGTRSQPAFIGAGRRLVEQHRATCRDSSTVPSKQRVACSNLALGSFAEYDGDRMATGRGG